MKMHFCVVAKVLFFCHNLVRKRVDAVYKYSNENPHGLHVEDCVVRALSRALGQSWGETYIDLSIQGYTMGDLLSSNAVWDEYMHSKGFSRETIKERRKYTVSDFAMEHPCGAFVVGTGTHAVAVVDGDIYDIWDCGSEIPLYFYERKE